MTTYVCPSEIEDMFADNPQQGREKATQWAESLDLRPGDMVFLPELGWHEFHPG